MQEKNIGHIVQIIGPVLDIRFQNGKLPNLLNAIEIEKEDNSMNKTSIGVCATREATKGK